MINSHPLHGSGDRAFRHASEGRLASGRHPAAGGAAPSYELGNVLLRRLGLPAAVVTDQLELIRRLCGPVVHPTPSWHAEAARLGERHRLTFHDASWATAARTLGCPLVSADRALLAAELAIPPTTAAAVLR